jgi:3-methyl-2-oxobutanoate hydroxymethyltransferase
MTNKFIKKIYEIIENLVKNNIPVMGHLGVLPQSAKNFKFKGEKISERKIMLNEAKLLESAGAFSVVLECVESSLAKIITKNVNIPTIGIGASANCDGQVLVTDDLLSLNPINVRFVKKYSNIRKEIVKAVSKYSKDVRKKTFPSKKYSY